MLAMRTSPNEHQQIIADRIAVDKATATSLIHQLERRGLAVRRQDADDGRRRTVRLSPHADAVIDEVAHKLDLMDDELLRPLDASERSELAEIWSLTSRSDGVVSQAPVDELERLLFSPGWLLRRTRQVHSRLWDDEVTRLTPPQYAALDVLHFGGSLEVLVTAREASLEESNGARLLHRLSRRGLIDRSPDPEDGRRILLTITALGRRTLLECSDGVRRVQAGLIGPLSAEAVPRFHHLTAAVARLD